MKSAQTTTLITVPHRCVVSRLRDPGCDIHADEFARVFARVIRRHQLFLSSTPRNLCDLNRVTCRDVLMRTKLRSQFKTKISQLVLDIHTFPSGAFPFELGIMYQHGNRSFAESLGRVMSKCTTLKWAVFGGGSQLNDILEDARQHQIPGVLLEFMDELTPHQVSLVALCVLQWIGKTQV